MTNTPKLPCEEMGLEYNGWPSANGYKVVLRGVGSAWLESSEYVELSDME